MYRNIDYLLFYMGVKIGIWYYVKNKGRGISVTAFSGK